MKISPDFPKNESGLAQMIMIRAIPFVVKGLMLIKQPSVSGLFS